MIVHRQRIVYITRDIERALGVIPNAHYRVIANQTPYAETIKAEFPDFVTLISGMKNTAALFEDPAVKSAVMGSEADAVVVFKNTERIEELADMNGWHLLNPRASIAERVENKITQVEWLGELAVHLPNYEIATGRTVRWRGAPMVIQWAHGHTGDGTILAASETELAAAVRAFPDRPLRASALVRGPSFTVNAVATEGRTLMGNINYQLTGLAPFTDNCFSTVGNDWSLTHTLLSAAEIGSIENIVGAIGMRLSESGWRGLFGVDLMRDEELGRIFLIEVNARQPAGSVFESHLQNANRTVGVHGMTVVEAHLAALQGGRIDQPLIPINDGAQVIQRVTKALGSVHEEDLEPLVRAGYRLVSYPNTEPNADLVRIQSVKGIMESHMKLNARGTEIAAVLAASATERS